MIRSLISIIGYALNGTDGSIGQCEDVLIEDRPWVVRYLVANTGRWLFGRRVLIPLDQLGPPDDTQRVVNVSLTRQEIRSSEPVSADPPVSTGFGERSFLYYGWPSAMAQTPLETSLIPPNAYDGRGAYDEEHRSFLRSTEELAGYALTARGETFGAVVDFFIDQSLWAVRYLLASVLYGQHQKHILVPVTVVDGVDWPDRRIEVDLAVHRLPEYPEYTARLPEAVTDSDASRVGRFLDVEKMDQGGGP